MFVILNTWQADRLISFAFWCTLGEWDQMRGLITANAQNVWTSFRSHFSSRDAERPDVPPLVWRVDVAPGEWTEAVMERFRTVILEPDIERSFKENCIEFAAHEDRQGAFPTYAANVYTANATLVRLIKVLGRGHHEHLKPATDSFIGQLGD